MEFSHSLTLNETALAQLPANKRPIFIFEWLRYLDRVLMVANKPDIKECQNKLVAQLLCQMNEAPGPPTRKFIARCLATLFSVGDTFLLFDTINKCNDILKSKDDSPSLLPTRLAAVTCLGAMYEKLGRMTGRSYEDSVTILLRTLRSGESQLRCEIMYTLEKMSSGMGSAACNMHRDIYKAAKLALTDRAMSVRCASSMCLLEMGKYSSFLFTTEMETLSQVCFRAFDGSNYEARCSVSLLLGTMLATTQNPPRELLRGTMKGGVIKLMTLEEVLGLLQQGFLKGGTSLFKGTGEMIKGSSSVSREVRVGVTQAYVHFVQELGSEWLERNIATLLTHLTDLIVNPKATTTHVDAVYSRQCVGFILRSTMGKMLGEAGQISACKDMVLNVIKFMNCIDVLGEGSKDSSEGSQNALACLLTELGCIIHSSGSTCTSLVVDHHINLTDAVIAVLLHPSATARLSAAWCLRCIGASVSSQLHPLIVRCCDRLDALKTSPEAIAGYSSAIAALVGCVCHTPLGIPHTRGKILFNIAEELLRSSSQSSRLSLPRTQAGWLIIGSIMTLGVGVVRGLLPRMLLLWKNSFPRSSKEIESEKTKGDAFTWQVTLEGRAGALSSMHSFLLHCGELVAEDTVRRLLSPVESALLMLSSSGTVMKQFGEQLKARKAMVRLRLYEVLCLLPPQSFESHYTSILKLLVSEFTLAESGANTTTSLLRSVCHADGSVLLGTWLHETDHKMIEDQLQPNSASGSGALEHDQTYLYRATENGPEGVGVPGPLPLGIVVIDASVVLFGQMFPLVAIKHRLKMLSLFGEMIRAVKSQRQEAVQINIFTAVICALKNLSDQKSSFGPDEVKKAAVTLLLGGLTHANPVLRVASAEAIGRMVQVVGDARFVAEMAQTSFDRLKSGRDVASRTGHSLALGCLHRYVGGMGSGQHLSTSISILLALAKDVTSPAVQVWALNALSLIADSGGPMFRSYVEPTLALLIELLLSVPWHWVDLHQCLGNCLQALITTVGPDLQGTSGTIVMVRWSLLCACALVQEQHDPTVQAEAISCLQQMHIFAPLHVNLAPLVPNLVKKLKSRHLLLRRASVSCLRQLAQREAQEVSRHALSLVGNGDESGTGIVVTESGLAGVIFSLLDMETDIALVRDAHHLVTSVLHALALEQLAVWLSLCREVLTNTTESANGEANAEGGEGGAEDDDMAQIHTGGEPDPHPNIPPRWTTRVFAAQCVGRLIQERQGDNTHFDLARAREMQALSDKADYLVLHLSELVRMGFMAATSDSDPLRLEGLHILNLIIEKFARIPEPEFPGHVILEQFQAQVGAALRPAFAPDTASHVTARACEVCSTWICSGVARDLNDLRRVHQLLVSSLEKLNKCNTKGVYNERASTLEQLAILRAWAEVYVVAANTSKASEGSDKEEQRCKELPKAEVVTGTEENLLQLVSAELVTLSGHWLAALKDQALLSLPPEFSNQLPHDGGAFYSHESGESVKLYYQAAWPPLLHAASLWLSEGGFEGAEKTEAGKEEGLDGDRFFLLLGICLEWLCSAQNTDDSQRSVICLKSLSTLLTASVPSMIVAGDANLANEIATVMHRQILSCDNIEIHQSAVDVLVNILAAAQRHLDAEKHDKAEKNENGVCDGCDGDLIGEGKETGEIVANQSLVFTALQVSLCILARHCAKVAPQVSASAPYLLAACRQVISIEQKEALLTSLIHVLVSVIDLCSPAGAVAILPSILFLLTGLLRECEGRKHAACYGLPLQAVLDALGSLASHRYSRDIRSLHEWGSLLQSTMVSILDMGKTNDVENVVDESLILTAMTTLMMKTSIKIMSSVNLMYPTINLFKVAVESPRLEVRLDCIQCLESIFSHSDSAVAVPYIQALAPHLLQFLHEPRSNITSATEVEVFIHALDAIELLIPCTQTNYRNEIVGILVGILVNTLHEDNSCGNIYTNALHTQVLVRLQKIGPQYPQEFRAILATKPELRVRLETALKGQQEAKSAPVSQQIVAPHRPTIQLKTDFSNFML